MQLTLTPQTIITASAFLSALIAIVSCLFKIHKWFLRQGAQDGEIRNLRKHHDDDMKSIKEEQTLLVYGILACLKGLKEQGCNGPVTEAIEEIEKHLNKKAHE